MRVGYQGIPGSNTDAAATQLMKRAGIEAAELVDCVSARRVVDRLEAGTIDLGVVAVLNSSAGRVLETADALQNLDVEVVERDELPVEHCLFAPDERTDIGKVERIYSHEQALAQCRESIRTACPDASVIPMADTARAAETLGKGSYGDSAAVICSRRAGEGYGLHLLRESFQDQADNRTEFHLIRLKVHIATRPASILERLEALLLSAEAMKVVLRGTIVATVLVAFLLRYYRDLSAFEAALSVAGAASLILFLTSDRMRTWLQLRTIGGCWIYEVDPTSGLSAKQEHELERVVLIDRGDRGVRLRGWRRGDGDPPRWESYQSVVSQPGTLEGALVYWYKNTEHHVDEPTLGVVSLNWSKDHATQRVAQMSGTYYGTGTGETGKIRYSRITKKDFVGIRSRIARDPSS